MIRHVCCCNSMTGGTGYCNFQFIIQCLYIFYYFAGCIYCISGFCFANNPVISCMYCIYNFFINVIM